MRATSSEARELGAAAPPRGPRPVVRAVNAVLFGLFAAAGFGAVARRAWLFTSSLGLVHPVLPWSVPFGSLFLALSLALALETLRTGAMAGSWRPLRTRDRWPLLLLVLGCFGVRVVAGEPRPPVSPTSSMIAALRRTAEALDAGYRDNHEYRLSDLDGTLVSLAPPGFVYRGCELRLRAVPIAQDGPQRTARPGDLPGTIYVAHAPGGQRLWLSALTLNSGVSTLLSASGQPLIIEARAGTHSAPGRDPLIPEYPLATPQ